MTSLQVAVAVVSVCYIGSAIGLFWRYRQGRMRAPARAVLPFTARLAAPPPPDLATVSGLTLMEAEDLMDWLEEHGFEERNLRCESKSAFAVQFRVDDAHPTLDPHPVMARRYSAG